MRHTSWWDPEGKLELVYSRSKLRKWLKQILTDLNLG